jgi:ATP-dependent Lon protease
MKDLIDLPKKVRQDLQIKPVTHMDQVLEIALGPKPHKEPARAKRHSVKKTEKSEESEVKETTEA